MAKRIEGPYDFSKKNFTTYADGAVWELFQGEDFHITPKSFAGAAREWAKREGLEVECKILDETPHSRAMVALRFRRPSAQKRVAVA
jgi:hypothetical protein